MFKLRFRRREQKESDFVAKWEMELFGRTLQVGLTKNEFSRAKGWLKGPKKLGDYLGSLRQNIKTSKSKPQLILKRPKK